MFSAAANSDRFARWLPPVLLLVAVWAMRPWESRLVADAPPVPAALAGSGSTLAVLGGLRPAVAGAFWLRANLAWERRDAAATTAWVELAVAADPGPLYFWLNGARMIAHDIREWRAETSPAAWRERVAREQAEKALAFLERGCAQHPAQAEFYLEMANIRLRALGDREGAAKLFRQAAEQPGAPWHAARIHAELLRELGRPREALDWLRRIVPGLPADDPAACREVVLQRIAELERETRGR